MRFALKGYFRRSPAGAWLSAVSAAQDAASIHNGNFWSIKGRIVTCCALYLTGEAVPDPPYIHWVRIMRLGREPLLGLLN
jgi:hypothetical protein